MKKIASRFSKGSHLDLSDQRLSDPSSTDSAVDTFLIAEKTADGIIFRSRDEFDSDNSKFTDNAPLTAKPSNIDIEVHHTPLHALYTKPSKTHFTPSNVKPSKTETNFTPLNVKSSITEAHVTPFNTRSSKTEAQSTPLYLKPSRPSKTETQSTRSSKTEAITYTPLYVKTSKTETYSTESYSHSEDLRSTQAASNTEYRQRAEQSEDDIYVFSVENMPNKPIISRYSLTQIRDDRPSVWTLVRENAWQYLRYVAVGLFVAAIFQRLLTKLRNNNTSSSSGSGQSVRISTLDADNVDLSDLADQLDPDRHLATFGRYASVLCATGAMTLSVVVMGVEEKHLGVLRLQWLVLGLSLASVVFSIHEPTYSFLVCMLLGGVLFCIGTRLRPRISIVTTSTAAKKDYGDDWSSAGKHDDGDDGSATIEIQENIIS